MRLFTALDLPAEIVDRLDRFIGDLRPLARIAWSKAANLHITTKFIGEWPDEKLPQLNAALRELGTRAPIPIRVRGLGFYPNQKSPRVFWAGIEAPQSLTVLAADTDAAVAGLGGEREPRRYSPHLTLARIKTPGGLDEFHKQVDRLPESEFGSFEATRFHLYLSKLGPGGSVYTKLSEFPFSTK